MMGQHTPGPWRVHLPMATPDPKHWLISGPKVCDGTVAKTSIKREADARLIAAAPDLLEALETLCATVTRAWPGLKPMPQMMNARAAIAKARGQ